MRRKHRVFGRGDSRLQMPLLARKMANMMLYGFLIDHCVFAFKSKSKVATSFVAATKEAAEEKFKAAEFPGGASPLDSLGNDGIASPLRQKRPEGFATTFGHFFTATAVLPPPILRRGVSF